jgi:hypothetical protein
MALSLCTARAQDSCRLQVSLLTCSPGSELYSIFGHSALRIVDSAAQTDIVYNYGTFDFGDPDFYSKFVKGKLLYFLSREAYPDFAYSYALEGRSIAEQVLDLGCTEKQQLREFIYNNLQGDNRYYRYDFLYDNCTTRLRDIVEKFRNPALKEGEVPQARGMSFRDGIHFYLDRGQMWWSKFGIDLLLGSRMDKTMTNREAMFLPEFLETSLDSTEAPGDQLVIKKELRLPAGPMEDGASWFSPLLLFSLFALVMILYGWGNKRPMKWFDRFFFLLIGLLGCLLLFMWLGTDHRQTKDNWNLAWAWPFHILAPFLLNKPSPNARRYFLIYFWVTAALLLAWIILPQELNTAVIPILLLAMARSWSISKDYGKNKLPA